MKKSNHSIKITSKHNFANDSWIGAGEVSGAKEDCDVVGYRIFVNGKEKFWMDLTISEALSLASVLTDACNQYLIKTGKYVPNKDFGSKE